MASDYSMFYTDNTTSAGNAATVTFNADFVSGVSTVIAEKKSSALDWLDKRIEEICVKL